MRVCLRRNRRNKFSTDHGRFLAEEFDFLNQRRNVVLDGGCILVNVDAKITEAATLATEGNMDVKAEGNVSDLALLRRPPQSPGGRNCSRPRRGDNSK